MSFQTFFNEAAAKPIKKVRKPNLAGYAPPPVGTKFKLNDIVVVNVAKSNKEDAVNSFLSYHPQYALPYIDGVGKVVSYKKNIFSSKYGVEFEDGNVIPIASGFLVGPFASYESAHKYKGKHSEQTLDIDAKDMAGFVPDSTVQVIKQIEDDFKRNFVNEKVGFRWLDEPLIIKYKKFDVYVLAFKPNTSNIDEHYLNFVNRNSDYERVDNPTRPGFDNGFVFCKVINKLTKQLQKTQVLTFADEGAGCYFLQCPNLTRYSRDCFRDGKVVNRKNLFDVSCSPIRAFSTKTQQRFLQKFALADDESLISTGLDYYKLLYNMVEGQPVKSKYSADFHEAILQENLKEISKYTFDCDASVFFVDSRRNIEHLPKHVTGTLTIVAKTLNSLEGLSECQTKDIHIAADVKRLEGFPESINVNEGVLRFNRTLDSLEGIPDQLNCDLYIGNLNSFIGARNCINKGSVQIQKFHGNSFDGFFKEPGKYSIWNVNHEKLEEYLKFRDLETKHPELEGIFS